MFSPSFAASATRSSSSDAGIAAVEHGLQELLGVGEEVVVVRDGLGLAADRDDRADVVAHHHADLALARRAVGALRGGRHALLAQQLDGLVEVAVGLLERALAVHHPGARRVAQLLDHRSGDLGHSAASSVARLGGVGCSARRLVGCGRLPRLSRAASAAARFGCAALLRPPAASALPFFAPCSSAARHLALAGLDPVGERLDHEVARADRVVVARDHVVGLVGIAVRVDERDHRQVQALRLAHGELLLAQVDDEDRVRLAAHVGDAAEVRLELLELGHHRDALLGRQQVELGLGLQRAQLVQPLDPVGDRAPVRQQPAEPAVVDVRHADAARLVADGVLRLLLRADEEHRAVPLGDRFAKL